MIKLILTDIDGTILPRGQKVVSENVRSAIREAIGAGIRVGVATGRAVSGVLPIFDGEATCVQTALATNGMQVYLDGRLVHEEHVSLPLLARVAEVAAREEGMGLICFDSDGRVHLVCGELDDLAVCFPSYAVGTICDGVVPDYPVTKANVFVRGDIARTQEALDIFTREVPELDFNYPFAGLLNIVPLGYSKAAGIDYLVEAAGIGLDAVMVFGDAANDLEMLEHVPNSVAVANATPEVLATARYHIGSCADEAVADVMRALAAGEWPFSE